MERASAVSQPAKPSLSKKLIQRPLLADNSVGQADAAHGTYLIAGLASSMTVSPSTPAQA
jgi:hypothetical protein